MKKYLPIILLLFSINSYSNSYNYFCSAIKNDKMYISNLFPFEGRFAFGDPFKNELRKDCSEFIFKNYNFISDVSYDYSAETLRMMFLSDTSINYEKGQHSYYNPANYNRNYNNTIVKINWKPKFMIEREKKSRSPRNNETTISGDLTNKDWWLNATLAMVKQLIKNRDINKPFGNSNETLLHLATYSNNPEIIHFLVESGGNLEAKNEYGRTPLDYAEYDKNNKMVDTITKYGYNHYPDVTDCVSIDFNSNSIGNFIHNNCNLGIAVWTCDKNPKHGGGCSKSVIC